MSADYEATKQTMLKVSVGDDKMLAGIALGWLALDGAQTEMRKEKGRSETLRADLTEAIFALKTAWPYVHGHCTIKSKRDEVQAVLVKHGDWADLSTPTA